MNYLLFHLSTRESWEKEVEVGVDWSISSAALSGRLK